MDCEIGATTHLARVDLLAAEGIVVGTHIGGVERYLWLVSLNRRRRCGISGS